MEMAVSIKRKFEEVDGSSLCSSPKESDDDISSSDSADSCDSVNPPTSRELSPTSILKKQKRLRVKNVRFDQVTVYYFTRRQGFTSVPSQGGSSLGMARRHNCIRRYTLCEFAQEQEHLHREMLRDHLKEEKLNVRKMKLTKNGTVESEEANVLTIDDVSDDDIDVDSIEVDRMSFPCGCSKDGCANAAGRIEFNPIRVRTHYLHTIMKLELENKQQDHHQQPLPAISHCSNDRHTEVQDYQEFTAENYDLENETAVMHLQSAEEMDRKKEEEDDLTSSSVTMDTSVDSLEVCILGDPVAGPDEACEGLATPVVIQAEVTPVSPVLCFAASTVQDNSTPEEQTYLTNPTVLYYQIDQSCSVGVNCSDREANYVDAGLESNCSKENAVENLIAATNCSLSSYVSVTEHFSENTGTSKYSDVQFLSMEDGNSSVNVGSNVYTESTKQEFQLHSKLQNGIPRAPDGDLCTPEPTVENVCSQSEGQRSPEEAPAANSVTM
ncbi:cysteine/serine-rich nuclear protein 2-like isoform X2 [Chiloscyllium plagiosum]|uniref:cysteine/serine-rich nuclear protein 2-like isoform X2 n=1 Tax=Chiloscyllium plagiosum TaxID=36176 RepID=UPI001CB8891A|nr:cysteine/serine-rich nuclear protein 2-like isoform X2 [Chiloscyllium plagiosum]